MQNIRNFSSPQSKILKVLGQIWLKCFNSESFGWTVCCINGKVKQVWLLCSNFSQTPSLPNALPKPRAGHFQLKTKSKQKGPTPRQQKSKRDLLNFSLALLTNVHWLTKTDVKRGFIAKPPSVPFLFRSSSMLTQHGCHSWSSE